MYPSERLLGCAAEDLRATRGRTRHVSRAVGLQLTGGGLGALIAVRFIFGVGEAGCFPNLTRAFSIWLPPAEKSRAQSILWLCARWGGALTPARVWAVLEVVTWRVSFGVFACLGLVWAWFFARWFRDEPRSHPSVNAAEWALLAANPPVARHDRVPWRLFLSSRTTWFLWAQYFFFSYCWYFYITWLSKFLKDEYGASHSKVALALLAGLPLLGGGFGNLIAGTLLPHLTRWTGSLGTARRLLAGGGFGLAALVFLFPAHHLGEPVVVMAAMGLASLCGDLSMTSSWSACMDVGGKFSGTYSGAMNMMGNLGGALGPVVVGYLLVATHQDWAVVFNVSAAVYFLGGLCWLFIDPATPLSPGGAPPEATLGSSTTGETRLETRSSESSRPAPASNLSHCPSCLRVLRARS